MCFSSSGRPWNLCFLFAPPELCHWLATVVFLQSYLRLNTHYSCGVGKRKKKEEISNTNCCPYNNYTNDRARIGRQKKKSLKLEGIMRRHLILLSTFLLNLSTHWKRSPENKVENTARLTVRGSFVVVEAEVLSFSKSTGQPLVSAEGRTAHPSPMPTYVPTPTRVGLDGEIHRLCFGVVDKGDRYWRLQSHFDRARWEQREGAKHVLVSLVVRRTNCIRSTHKETHTSV